MEFQVWDKNKPDVTYTPAPVSFPAFEFYKQQARLIADQVSGTKVTEENIKEVKSLLADARKVSEGLNKRRIEIKKEILSQYDVFEKQVKELSAIIDEADEEVRQKVRTLEELERNEKLKKIEDLWGRRVGNYKIYDLAPNAFDMWLDYRMLNKSVSMKAIETEMVEWLEDSEKAIDTLLGMDDEYLVEYLGCFNLATAINTVNRRNETRKIISNAKDEETEEKAVFIVYGKKDIKLTESLLNENEIEYQKQ